MSGHANFAPPDREAELKVATAVGLGTLVARHDVLLSFSGLLVWIWPTGKNCRTPSRGSICPARRRRMGPRVHGCDRRHRNRRRGDRQGVLRVTPWSVARVFLLLAWGIFPGCADSATRCHRRKGLSGCGLRRNDSRRRRCGASRRQARRRSECRPGRLSRTERCPGRLGRRCVADAKNGSTPASRPLPRQSRLCLVHVPATRQDRTCASGPCPSRRSPPRGRNSYPSARAGQKRPPSPGWFRASPCDSMRLAAFTVSPHTS